MNGNGSFFNNAFNFKFGFDNLLFGDDEVGCHVIIDLPEKQEFLFEIPHDQELDQDDVNDDLEDEQTWANYNNVPIQSTHNVNKVIWPFLQQEL